MNAKWIECKNGAGYKCSNCKARIRIRETFTHNYCYRCGCKMGGDDLSEPRPITRLKGLEMKACPFCKSEKNVKGNFKLNDDYKTATIEFCCDECLIESKFTIDIENIKVKPQRITLEPVTIKEGWL